MVRTIEDIVREALPDAAEKLDDHHVKDALWDLRHHNDQLLDDPVALAGAVVAILSEQDVRLTNTERWNLEKMCREADRIE